MLTDRDISDTEVGMRCILYPHNAMVNIISFKFGNYKEEDMIVSL